MVRWFERGEVAPGDLIITQHDMCAWVPFVSSAEQKEPTRTEARQ